MRNAVRNGEWVCRVKTGHYTLEFANCILSEHMEVETWVVCEASDAAVG